MRLRISQRRLVGRRTLPSWVARGLKLWRKTWGFPKRLKTGLKTHVFGGHEKAIMNFQAAPPHFISRRNILARAEAL